MPVWVDPSGQATWLAYFLETKMRRKKKKKLRKQQKDPHIN